MRLGAVVLAVAVAASLSGCVEHKCDGGEACRGTNGDCMTCGAGYGCNTGGTCGSTVNGVACCTASIGGGGGTGCGCGANCNSNGVCCPSGYYGCSGYCYSTSVAANQAGCTSFTTCCP